ncbi:PHP domain protein [uncultured archaeon]|nr:PHP domain protein [uncultured archaeon]
MINKYIDLHTHTYYSDGVLTPTDNARIARINGIDILAITDHDKTDGYEEAKIAGERYQVQIIPGTEISTDKYHILGLGVDIKNNDLVNLLKKSAEEQKKVCASRIDALRIRGIPITFEKVLEVFPKSRLGKMNIMYAMMQDRECQDYLMKHEGQKLTKEIYDAYLRDENGKFVTDKMTAVTPKLAIDAVHSAGGIAILAHPPLDVKEMAEMDVLLREGIDGIEVQTRNNGRNEPFIEFAKRNNLLITYGSDFHGGVFNRDTLSSRGNNILEERLAKALKLEVE